MPDALQTTSYTSSSIHGDFDGSLSVPEKKRSLLSAFWSVLDWVRWNPFPSSIIISVILAGNIAGIVSLSYQRDFRPAYRQIPSNKSGVSGVTSPSWVLTDTMYRRSHSSDIVSS